MKPIIALVGILFSFCLFADIPTPQDPDVSSIELRGQDALNLYEALNVKAQPEATLRNLSRFVKVYRSQSGESQIVCRRTVTNAGTRTTAVDGDCTIEKSESGEALPVYVVTRIVG